MLKMAVTDWKTKWVPAIVAFGENCRKKVSAVSDIKSLYTGK